MGCGASKVDEVHTTAPSDRIVAAPVKNVEVKSDVQPKIKATVEDTSNAESRTATDTDTPQPAMTSDAAALVETKALEGEAEDTFANTSQQQQQAETTVVEEESSAETPNEAATQPATRSGWDGYIDNLMNAKVATSACIFGLEDGSIWAQSSGFKLSEKERQTIIKVFAQDNEVVLAAELEGLHNDMAHDEKDYIFIQHDDEKVLLKKGTDGVVCMKTNQAIISATFDSSVKGEQVATTLGRVKDYLIKNGY